VNIGRDRLVFNKTEVTLDRLRRELDDLKLPGKKDDERFVVVDTARDVPFQRYYEVVTAIARAGGVLALVEQVEESKSP
jgi:biopolymer transport protein ExbD